MGLSHSKAHPRVIKVAPLQNQEEETPSAGPADFALDQNLEEKSSYSLARLQDWNKGLEEQLPPLRETWYGRYSAVLQESRAMYFDIPLEQAETSIIKRHPPRRLQFLFPVLVLLAFALARTSFAKRSFARVSLMIMGVLVLSMTLAGLVQKLRKMFAPWVLRIFLRKLEPMDLPQVITYKSLLSQQEARTTHKTKELEKKMQTPIYTSGKRQYLHKMQMLEMNRKRQEDQMDLKNSLHREARINKQKLKDHKAKKILQSIPKDDDHNLLTTLPDETLKRDPGSLQNAEFLEHQAGNNYCPQKTGKMETWLHEQEVRGQLLWDSSSSDSDELGKDVKKPRALVRTRTERIPLFDEFFDQE